MITLADIIGPDLQAIAADLGSPIFEWQGEEFECIPGTDSEDRTFSFGESILTVDVVLTVRKELFTNDIFPESQQKLKYKDVEYRIGQVKQDATQTFLKLFCGNPNKGI